MDKQTLETERESHPPLRQEAAAFYGYTPFPSIMTLYTDFSGLTTPFTTLRLCAGTNEADLLYQVDMHYGYTPRGPLHFRPGLYLRNGPTAAKDPILAAAGDEARLPVLIQMFNLGSVILLPPVDAEEARNPRDMVTEVMTASTTSASAGGKSSRRVTFRFAIEVGSSRSKMHHHRREEFEWLRVNAGEKVPAAPTPAQESGGTSSASAADKYTTATARKGTRFVLLRSCPAVQSMSDISTRSRMSESSDGDDGMPNLQGQSEILAELVFTNVMSWSRLFTLEFKGAATGLTGEPRGDRWKLMVVMTALRIYWLRSYGKAGKGVVRAAEKVRGI